MDGMQKLSLTQAAREAYTELVTTELPAPGAGAQHWVAAMKAVSRFNSLALHPALVAIADQLEAGFHHAVRTQDPTRLHTAFTAAQRRLRPHAGVR